jgi:hypothetical protein
MIFRFFDLIRIYAGSGIEDFLPVEPQSSLSLIVLLSEPNFA